MHSCGEKSNKAKMPLDAFHDIAAGKEFQPDQQQHTRSWYFTKDEIDNHSPSRKDGIDCMRESSLRKSYCSFLRDLGVKLRV